MKTNLSKEMDSEMLFELVRKADTDKDAAFKLGVMYLNGNNVCQDTQRALFYFQQASELGHSGVEAIYAYLYKCGAPNFEPNLFKAAEYFELAGFSHNGDEVVDETLLWEAVNIWFNGGIAGTALSEQRGLDLLDIMEEKEIYYAAKVVQDFHAYKAERKTRLADLPF